MAEVATHAMEGLKKGVQWLVCGFDLEDWPLQRAWQVLHHDSNLSKMQIMDLREIVAFRLLESALRRNADETAAFEERGDHFGIPQILENPRPVSPRAGSSPRTAKRRKFERHVFDENNIDEKRLEVDIHELPTCLKLELGLLVGGPESVCADTIRTGLEQFRFWFQSRLSQVAASIRGRLCDVETRDEMVAILINENHPRLCNIRVAIHKSNEGCYKESYDKASTIIDTWNSHDFWVREYGHRYVSAECSSDGACQRLMPLWSFMASVSERNCVEAHGSVAQCHRPGWLVEEGRFYDHTKESPKHCEYPFYLVLFPIFTVFPELSESIRCYENYFLKRYKDGMDGAPVDVNSVHNHARRLEHSAQIHSFSVNSTLYFGPRGTVTDLHHDPDDNYLFQIVGWKFVRIYPKTFPRELLQPREDKGRHHFSKLKFHELPNHETIGKLGNKDLDHVLQGARRYEFENGSYVMWNLSSDLVVGTMDVSVTSAAKNTVFQGKDGPYYRDIVLGPGDCLFISKGDWHYVEALSASISVSFMIQEALD